MFWKEAAIPPLELLPSLCCILCFIATCWEAVTAQETVKAKETVKLDSWPINLAPAAKVSASSELDEHYPAKNAVDGKVPFMMEDSSFTFQWDALVTVKEIVYVGRFHRRRGFIAYTKGGRSENFEQYALYVDYRPGGGFYTYNWTFANSG